MHQPSIIAEPPSGQVPERYVFVYGTLRRGESNDINRLQPAPRPVGTARIAGTLYDLGAYPGLVLGGFEGVLGEVYRIAPALEAVLDAIEEIGHLPDDEYIKVDITAPLDESDGLVRCLVYVLNPLRWPHQRDSRNPIAGGDWKQFCAER